MLTKLEDIVEEENESSSSQEDDLENPTRLLGNNRGGLSQH